MSSSLNTGLRLSLVNRIAAIKLKDSGVVENPRELPMFQLMQWGLAEGIVPTHQRNVSELLRLSNGPDQQQASDYLLDNLPGGLAEFEKHLLILPPRAAAEALLELLDMRLKVNPRNPYPAGEE
ncbi:MAG: hypothetical protein C0616_01455 [Desulfuromonas sp.]|nr:MAG: hypothetical protein C0616_01455 [Desulfuromonas sp.]